MKSCHLSGGYHECDLFAPYSDLAICMLELETRFTGPVYFFTVPKSLIWSYIRQQQATFPIFSAIPKALLIVSPAAKPHPLQSPSSHLLAYAFCWTCIDFSCNLPCCCFFVSTDCVCYSLIIFFYSVSPLWLIRLLCPEQFLSLGIFFSFAIL